MPFDEAGRYVFEDIAFVNTVEFSRAAQHFKKHGCYTFAPPDSQEHKDFWDIEEDRRINGMTLPGKLLTNARGEVSIQQVHITGEHYGFLNYARILRTKDQDNEEIKKIIKNSHLVKHSKKVGNKNIDFPSFHDWQYNYFIAKAETRDLGLHMIVDKSRRKGYSYMEGWDCADTVNMNPSSTVLIGAYDLKYITKGKQLMPMAKSYLDFLETHTDWTRHYLLRGKSEVLLGYKDEGSQVEKGWLSHLIAVSFMNNPDAAIGKDAIKIKLEEIGKFPNLKDALDVTTSSMEAGDLQTGHMVMFGTGGTDEANWRDAQEIFYNPEAFGCAVFDNIWDEGAKNTGCGFFHAQWANLEPYIDEHGNSKVEEAKASIEKDRLRQKALKSATQYVKYIGQRCNTPRESFASGSDNIFPTAEIVFHKAKVENDPDFKYFHRCGQLLRLPEGIRFKSNEELSDLKIVTHEPILNFPLKRGQDVHGTYVEYFSPYRDKTGRIPEGLYRIWHDPYAHDKDKKDLTIKDSLGAAYVYQVINNFTPHKGDILVAKFVGRPNTTDDYNEILLRMSEYWNAQVFFENDRGDVKGYFGRHKKLNLLADEPDLEWAAELKGSSRRGKGMNMTPNRKSRGAVFLRDWLIEKRGTDEFGNTKMNLHYIYDPALLSELLIWNMKGNFDRVSSMIIGMYDMKESLTREIKEPKPIEKDDYWNRNLYSN